MGSEVGCANKVSPFLSGTVLAVPFVVESNGLEGEVGELDLVSGVEDVIAVAGASAPAATTGGSSDAG
jgi:hypothetical protein